VPAIVTLLTDFGTRDAYVGAMKGVLLSHQPDRVLVDITHDITPQDIMEAAFVLRESAPYFPAGTVHLVVVDPGVGTERRPIAMRHNGQIFIGPDNGLFSLYLGDRNPDEVVGLDIEKLARRPPSRTFHGRDIFAPAAAELAKGMPLHLLGRPIEEMTRLHWALPIGDEQGVRGWVIHIDRFGNCITNITERELGGDTSKRRFKGYAGGAIFSDLSQTYADVDPGEPLMLIGSGGFLEIAINGGNAAELLSIRKSTAVNVVYRDDR
jgi:S-adenosyl-L-methionine hydrolase (adenosine-forming)